MNRILFSILVGLASSSVLAADAVLVKQGDTIITERDVRLALETYVPEKNRLDLQASEKKLRDFVAQLFAVRKLAEEGRNRQMSADELWKVNSAAERANAQVQLDYLVGQKAAPDFEQVARETYAANPKEYMQPEQVHAQHILIKFEGRTKEDALKLATHVMELASKPGQDFGKLAAEYTEDVAGKTNGGDLGFFGRNKMVKPFEDAVFALSKQGQLAGPVESPFGYHVIKLVERRAEAPVPFEKVRDTLVRSEEIKYRRRAIGQEYERVGKLPGIEVNQEAISGLVRRLDFKAHAHGNE